MDSKKYRQSKKFSDEDEQSRAHAGGVLSLLKGPEKKAKKSVEKKRNTATEGSKRGKKEKKKDKEKPEDTLSTFSTTPTATTPTQMSMAPQLVAANPLVERWIRRALENGVEKLRDEFRGLAKYTRADMTVEQFTKNCNPDVNVSKNRYQDVPCQDQFAVKMQQPPASCAYIHANFVPTPMSETRFICTQGPLDHTVEDFWWMIVQQKVEQIVMLCKTIEMGKFKCAQYWPATMGEKKEFKGSKLVVENMSGTKPMERDGEIQITQLNVTADGQTISVRHLHWTEWPDRGVPDCKLTSLELLSAVRGSKAPIVVHCSAGIGRTGSIVAMEYILEKISTTSDKMHEMPELVKYIRDHRAYSIQNDLQYLFIHRVMLAYFLEKYGQKYTAVLNENKKQYEQFITDYKVAVGQA